MGQAGLMVGAAGAPAAATVVSQERVHGPGGGPKAAATAANTYEKSEPRRHPPAVQKPAELAPPSVRAGVCVASGCAAPSVDRPRASLRQAYVDGFDGMVRQLPGKVFVGATSGLVLIQKTPTVNPEGVPDLVHPFFWARTAGGVAHQLRAESGAADDFVGWEMNFTGGIRAMGRDGLAVAVAPNGAREEFVEVDATTAAKLEHSLKYQPLPRWQVPNALFELPGDPGSAERTYLYVDSSKYDSAAHGLRAFVGVPGAMTELTILGLEVTRYKGSRLQTERGDLFFADRFSGAESTYTPAGKSPLALTRLGLSKELLGRLAIPAENHLPEQLRLGK